MRMPKREEKGFTLIELLIVVAILGVLAAVVIPNVGRFIGRGEEEAKETEFANVQSAVVSMMVDNNLATLPHPVSAAVDRTQEMDRQEFLTALASSTDKETDPYGQDYDGSDKDGYILYQHDIHGGDTGSYGYVNYVATGNTSYWYTCDASGTITQYDSAP
jgi:prepilin-type N-terminal cleavage/methylation domain-containing protein